MSCLAGIPHARYSCLSRKREEEARRAADTFLAAHPGMTISATLEALPMNARRYIDRFAEGIRRLNPR